MLTLGDTLTVTHCDCVVMLEGGEKKTEMRGEKEGEIKRGREGGMPLALCLVPFCMAVCSDTNCCFSLNKQIGRAHV